MLYSTCGKEMKSPSLCMIMRAGLNGHNLETIEGNVGVSLRFCLFLRGYLSNHETVLYSMLTRMFKGCLFELISVF